MKKRVIIILCINLIALSLIACGAETYKKEAVSSNTMGSNDEVKKSTSKGEVISEEQKEPKVLETKPDSISTKKKISKVIVVDPGHGSKANLQKEPIAPGASELKIKDGGGAQGISTGTPEYVVNLKVSMFLKNQLEQKGYTVIMTKTDNAVSLGNVERAEIGNKAEAALVVRVHADSSTSRSAAGASMLIPSPINENTKVIYSESKRCGSIILETLIQQVGMKNRGVMEKSDMTGFNWSKVPVILVELGFLSNPVEDKLLSSEEYEKKLAKALADGIAAAVK